MNSLLNTVRAHNKENELTPRQTEKIAAAKQTLKIDGAGYVSHFKAVFCIRIVAVCDLGSSAR